MTDKEIIKALECCPKAEMTVDCKALGCPVYQKKGCGYVLNCDIDSTTDAIIEGLSKDALDLINRQKAEIERLETNCLSMAQTMPNMAKAERAEAVKEFAERLKEYVESYDVTTGYRVTIVQAVEEETIDNLVKEMVGEG